MMCKMLLTEEKCEQALKNLTFEVIRNCNSTKYDNLSKKQILKSSFQRQHDILERLIQEHFNNPTLEPKEEISIFKQAIQEYGTNAQLDMAIEEMSELTKEICKNKRGKDNRSAIIEEMADVYIMLKQLEIIFSIDEDEINEAIDFKVDRLKERLEHGQER